MTDLYVDSSVLVRHFLGQPEQLREWEDRGTAWISVIGPIETRRTLHKARLQGEIDDSALAALLTQMHVVEATLTILDLDRPIQAVAGGPLPLILRTMDAVHLASALAVREEYPDIAFATHDRRLAMGARAFGFHVLGV